MRRFLPEPIKLTQVRIPSGEAVLLNLAWKSEAGVIYQIRNSVDMIVWVAMEGDYPSSGVTMVAQIEIDPTATAQFYRVTKFVDAAE